MALTVPVTEFDQSKLEQMLRNIPAAYVREENMGEFLRKHYLFPKEKGEFQVKCQADYYNGASIPSVKKCEISTSARVSGDEVMIDGRDLGLNSVKLYSTERVYGQAFDGRYRELFRYMFNCQSTCKITFALKPAESLDSRRKPLRN